MIVSKRDLFFQGPFSGSMLDFRDVKKTFSQIHSSIHLRTLTSLRGAVAGSNLGDRKTADDEVKQKTPGIDMGKKTNQLYTSAQ